MIFLRLIFFDILKTSTVYVKIGGLYEIGLGVKSYDRVLPEGYKYKFSVYVDGDYKGEVEIEGDHLEYNTGSIDVELTSGTHYVEFKSVHDETDEDFKIQINEAFFNTATDFNRDGVVDALDLQIMQGVIQRIYQEGRADLNEDGTVDSQDSLIVDTSLNLLDEHDFGINIDIDGEIYTFNEEEVIGFLYMCLTVSQQMI